MLDIARAYDAVARSFLFRIMVAAGCGPPMLRWLQLLPSYCRGIQEVFGRHFRPFYVKVLQACWARGVEQAMARASSGVPATAQCGWYTGLASVELPCSRLLGLELSALGRGLLSTGYAAAEVWYIGLKEFALIIWRTWSAHLNFTVDGKPPRPDGAATS
jgi:hypothetical protein